MRIFSGDFRGFPVALLGDYWVSNKQVEIIHGGSGSSSRHDEVDDGLMALELPEELSEILTSWPVSFLARRALGRTEGPRCRAERVGLRDLS